MIIIQNGIKQAKSIRNEIGHEDTNKKRLSTRQRNVLNFKGHLLYSAVSCHPSVVYVLIYTNWLKTRYNIKCMQI